MPFDLVRGVGYEPKPNPFTQTAVETQTIDTLNTHYQFSVDVDDPVNLLVLNAKITFDNASDASLWDSAIIQLLRNGEQIDKTSWLVTSDIFAAIPSIDGQRTLYRYVLSSPIYVRNKDTFTMDILFSGSGPGSVDVQFSFDLIGMYV